MHELDLLTCFEVSFFTDMLVRSQKTLPILLESTLELVRNIAKVGGKDLR